MLSPKSYQTYSIKLKQLYLQQNQLRYTLKLSINLFY
ncbi:hypothetical protein pb186bvf_002658 [Paramecium bursaria]